MPWEKVFNTENRSQVETYCERAQIKWEWKADGGLRTRQLCQGMETHPRTGDTVWFNQAHLFHISNLQPDVRETLVDVLGIEEIPRNVYFADGRPIPDSLLEDIRGVLAEQAVIFPWQAGDVLMLDNMLVAHARTPFKGGEKNSGRDGRAARQSHCGPRQPGRLRIMNARPKPRRPFPRDFVTHLRTLANARPAQTALTVVRTDSQVSFTYAQLEVRVRALAAELQSRFEPGERALLLLDNDEHYVIGFLACLYAGLIAVPLFAPESARERHLERLRAVALDAQPRCILTTQGVRTLLDSTDFLLERTPVLAVDAPRPDRAEPWRECIPRESDTAFLQYTSGSTSVPKGVVISHANLMANEARDRSPYVDHCRGSFCLVAAAVSRHGAGRRAAAAPASGHSFGARHPATLPGGPGQVAALDLAASGHD